MEFIAANTVALNALARAMKGALDVPGVVSIEEEITSGRTGSVPLNANEPSAGEGGRRFVSEAHRLSGGREHPGRP